MDSILTVFTIIITPIISSCISHSIPAIGGLVGSVIGAGAYIIPKILIRKCPPSVEDSHEQKNPLTLIKKVSREIDPLVIFLGFVGLASGIWTGRKLQSRFF